jgi:hypothetical protein
MAKGLIARHSIKEYFLDLAVHRSAERLGQELRELPFEPYAPVRRQLLCVLRAVNLERKKAGFEPVPRSAFCFLRRISRPFEASCELRRDWDGLSEK